MHTMIMTMCAGERRERERERERESGGGALMVEGGRGSEFQHVISEIEF